MWFKPHLKSMTGEELSSQFHKGKNWDTERLRFSYMAKGDRVEISS